MLNTDLKAATRKRSGPRSYFTRIEYQWLRRMVAHRIVDPVILQLLQMAEGRGVTRRSVIPTEEGTRKAARYRCAQ